jgi:hypothetical protein
LPFDGIAGLAAIFGIRRSAGAGWVWPRALEALLANTRAASFAVARTGFLTRALIVRGAVALAEACSVVRLRALGREAARDFDIGRAPTLALFLLLVLFAVFLCFFMAADS